MLRCRASSFPVQVLFLTVTRKHLNQYHENRWTDLRRGQVVVMNIRGAKTGCVFEVGVARGEVMSLQGVVVVWPPDGQVLA